MDQEPAQPTITTQTSGSKSPLLIFLIILVLVILGIGGYLFARGQQPKEPATKVATGLPRDVITIAATITPSGIFPNSQAEFNDKIFNNNIFDGLSRIVAGKVGSGLAKSWTNPNETTWRFSLQRNVKFHNGSSFTAKDVKFSIEEALKSNWPSLENLATVKSVKVIDDYTVDIETSFPDPVLLNRLVTVFIVSEKQFKEEKGEFKAVGTGPYKLTKLDKEGANLEQNGNYFLGAPKVKKVVYKFFPEDTSDEDLLKALRSGQVDLVRLSGSKVATEAKSSFQVKALADPFIIFLWLDAGRDKSPFVDKEPNPLKNKLVRQAIYKAIDIDSVIKEASLSAKPASQFVTDAIFGYDPNISRPKPSVEEAKSLMKKAGVESGFGLTLDVPGYRAIEGEAIAKQLAKINIKVKVNPVRSYAELGGKIDSEEQNISAYILDYGAETYDAGEIFTSILHTLKGDLGESNLLTMGYVNPEIDKLAEEIATTFDPKTRLAKLQEATVAAMEEMPMVPLYSKEFFFVFRNNFDWEPTAFGAVYPLEISGREIVTK